MDNSPLVDEPIVANAGALGFITAHMFQSAEELEAEIKRTRDATDKPFGVNMTILPSLNPIPYDEYRRAIIETGIKIVETAGRNPVDHMPDFKANGVRVIHKCTSARHAVTAAKLGVDVISIDGFECAGHPGEDDIGIMVLLPATVDQVDIPVIASGCMADGRSLIAALALGADGVNMGTRFMATKEAPIHQKVKEALVSSDERSTALILRTLKNTSRVYGNSVAKKAKVVQAIVGELGLDVSVHHAPAQDLLKSHQFDVDYDLNDPATAYQGRLVFEPYLSPAQGAVQQNVWQNWYARGGMWYT